MNNIIDTQPRRGFKAAIGRFFERLNVAVELHYIERDIAYERAHLAALPAKVSSLEQYAQTLRVQQAVLRGPAS